MTIALVHSFPLASQSLPKRMALTGLLFEFSWAQRPQTKVPASNIPNKKRIFLIGQTPLRAHSSAAQLQTSNAVVSRKQPETAI
jgi:hypothetical protein